MSFGVASNNKIDAWRGLASDVGVTPALRRRRERAERQRSFMREQQETAAMLRVSLGIAPEDAENGNCFTTISLHQLPKATLIFQLTKFYILIITFGLVYTHRNIKQYKSDYYQITKFLNTNK